MENIGIFNVIGSIPTALLIIVLIIYRIKGINIRTLIDIKMRCEIYAKIITEKNETLSYIYLKEYLGIFISNGMAKYILNSTKFYEIITAMKNAYSYIKPEPENDKIKLKDCAKARMVVFIILYLFFLLPALFLIIFSNIVIQDGYLISAIIITISFTIIAMLFWYEAGNISQAIRLMKSLEEDRA